ncbi:MAG: sodium:proton antiporter [Chlamydiales bacterium]|nr:sodium:proton antiporter [Chlamydiales bacterium]
MIKVIIFSTLIIAGILFSQWIDLSAYRNYLQTLTLTALSYIMIEVGLEFTIDKSRLKSYGKDYLIAMTAATFPWIFCTLWIWSYFDIDLTDATIIGRFAAPTSAGLLFTMLAAAGLGTTWVFKKARILAIFDDLDTILLIIPLQMLHIGVSWHALALICIIIFLLLAAYRFLHRMRWPISRIWVLAYAIILTVVCELFEKTTLINIEVLLPSFALGCILYNPHDPNRPLKHAREHAFIEPSSPGGLKLDNAIKFIYMFLIGCSLPKISFQTVDWTFLLWHVLALTFLSNLGKLYPLFCYKKDASLRERTALSIAMWPRGEVGVGILLISMNYALPDIVIQLAGLSLTLNLLLTGLFIYLVIWILKGKSAISKC